MTTATSGAAGFAAAIMTALSNGHAIRTAREGLWGARDEGAKNRARLSQAF